MDSRAQEGKLSPSDRIIKISRGERLFFAGEIRVLIRLPKTASNFMIRKIARKKIVFGFDFQRLQFRLETIIFTPVPDDLIYQVSFWQSYFPVSIRFCRDVELK